MVKNEQKLLKVEKLTSKTMVEAFLSFRNGDGKVPIQSQIQTFIKDKVRIKDKDQWIKMKRSDRRIDRFLEDLSVNKGITTVEQLIVQKLIKTGLEQPKEETKVTEEKTEVQT